MERTERPAEWRGRNLKPNNDPQLETWRCVVFLLGIGGTSPNAALMAGEKEKKGEELDEGRDETWTCVRDGRQTEKRLVRRAQKVRKLAASKF